MYFITKNHSFSDGNKRIAATMFLYDRVRCHHGSFLKFITSTFSSVSKVIVPFLM
ncbi:MAG: Fic family protein [Treponema sp.]|nr:Fic family protein [Treponema sp.]